MWRHWLIPAAMALWLYGAQRCDSLFDKSIRTFDGHRAYAVKKNLFVSLHAPKNFPVVARDRLLGLTLFRAPSGRPFSLWRASGAVHLCVDGAGKDVRILAYPVALNPGRYAPAAKEETALFGLCCRLAGITDDAGGWYDARMIGRLLKGDTHHGEIGIRLDTTKKIPVIRWVNPYCRTGLRPGDRIEGVGTLIRPNTYETMARIDRCREGETLEVVVRREGKRHFLKVPCRQRIGGGRLSDTFLESFGLYFDGHLRIVSLEEGSAAQKAGLKRGDRLIAVEGQKVDSPREVRDAMTRIAEKDSVPQRLLWVRRDFQFFLRLGRL